MKRYGGLLAALVAALLIVVCVRMFVALLLVIPADGEQPALYAGDRVWVSRTSYGVRLPLCRLWGYKRIGASPVGLCDWVAFNNPSSGLTVRSEQQEIFVGRCLGLPGDTLWLNQKGLPSRHKDKRQGFVWPVVVPRQGYKVKIEPWSARLYAQAINSHEPVKAAVINDSLCVDGRMRKYYSFNQDYYWMASSSDTKAGMDSRVFGFVPETHLVGRLVRVLYSIDPQAPWYKPFRTERFGVSLP